MSRCTAACKNTTAKCKTWRSADFRVAQQVKAFETQITQYREQVVEYTSVLNKLREQAQINQRAEHDLLAFQETLRQRTAELGEVERLFEERVKRQFEEFLGEFEKRWSKIPPRLEERWHEHELLSQRVGQTARSD